MHARSLAAALVEGPATINFKVHYDGLKGRELTSLSGRELLFDGHVTRQDMISLSTMIEAGAIDANLPEILLPLLEPLYALFDFFGLPAALVAKVTAEMRATSY